MACAFLAPCREWGVWTLRKLQSKYSLDVSVPSRGVRYLNLDEVDNYIDEIGFRPLAGIKVSEQQVDPLQEVVLKEFPSPLGEQGIWTLYLVSP